MRKTALALYLFIVALVTPGLTQLSDLQDDVQAKTQPEEFEYKGSNSCSGCHDEASPGNKLDKVTDFVFMTEYTNWLSQDPHVMAYLSIIPDDKIFRQVRGKLIEISEKVAARKFPEWEENSNQRSMNILTNISGCKESEVSQLFQKITLRPELLTVTDALSEVPPLLTATVKQCLSCHAGWDNSRPDFDFEVVKFGMGVSCEACHGPSSKWLDEHDEPDWRLIDSRVKEEKFGFTNVRQPIARSRQCFSCHIGDVDQGRVVTHAMYAAGHPPLPSIEIESYADQIPRHWRYLPEKTAEFTNATGFKENFAADLGMRSASDLENDFPRTRNLLVGGLMAAAHSVELLSESAGEYINLQNEKDKLPAKASLNPWPEFAAFDCAACHHDLKTAGWERGFAGVPGRPPAPYWPRTLSKLGLAWLDTQQPTEFVDDFRENQKELQDALDRQPFGNPNQLHEVGTQHAEFLEKIASRIQSKPLNRDDARLILRLLCGREENPVFSLDTEAWDFHSARQLGWAIRLIYSEITHPVTIAKAIDEINVSDEFTAPDGNVAAAFDELRIYLMLDLAPTGKITPLQTRFLNQWRDFDRKRFLELIKDLSEAIEKSEPSESPESSDKSEASEVQE